MSRAFRAVLELHGTTATGIVVPPDIVEQLAAGKRPAVRATLAGRHTYRTSLGVVAGRCLLPVSAAERRQAGLRAGDEVDVELEVDTAPREVVVPPDLAAALGPEARAAFDALSYSNRRRHVLAVDGARTPETRARRIARTVEELTAPG